MAIGPLRPVWRSGRPGTYNAVVCGAREHAPAGGPGPGSRRQRLARLAAVVTIVAAVAAAYANSFRGAFLLDDARAIVTNHAIRDLTAVPPLNRPLVHVSLAINYAVGGLNEWGYHLFNLMVHLIAALALFGLVRRTLLTERLRRRFGPVATPVAWAAALIWAVHPLQTGAVTYVIQRAESMMGMFVLLAMYFASRGLTGGRRWGWFAGALAALAAGLGSKEVAVAAPPLLLLYDRTFAAGSFRAALRRHWPLHAGAWAMLVLPAVSLAMLRPGAAAGVGGGGVTPLSYAASQPAVILHYLRLALWPDPLCLDYARVPVSDALELAMSATAIALLLGATLWALWQSPPLGFLGAWFFLILAPTSSFIPLVDLVFEHRMYLPLAALTTGATAGAFWAAGLVGAGASAEARRRVAMPLAVGIAGILASVLAAATFLRNRDYADEERMWHDVIAHRPANPRAYLNLGKALEERGRPGEALRCYAKALLLKPDYHAAHVAMGDAMVRVGRFAAAERHYRRAIEVRPSMAQAHNGLGRALAGLGRLDEAIASHREAVRLMPKSAEMYNNLGAAQLERGLTEAAVKSLGEAVRLDPDLAGAHVNHGRALLQKGRPMAAAVSLRRALELDPRLPGVEYRLGLALAMQGRWRPAVARFRAALERPSGDVRALNALAWLLATCPDGEVRDGREAVILAERLREATGPRHAGTLDTLAAAYAEGGRFDEAVAAIEQAVDLAEQAGREAEAARYRARLELYRAGKPFREEPVGAGGAPSRPRRSSP